MNTTNTNKQIKELLCKNSRYWRGLHLRQLICASTVLRQPLPQSVSTLHPTTKKKGGGGGGRAHDDIPEKHNNCDLPNRRNIYRRLLLHIRSKILVGRKVDTNHATTFVSPPLAINPGGLRGSTLSVAASGTCTPRSGRR